MTCDLSDPSIAEAYKQVLAGDVSWLLLGYMDTREKLFLYQKGDGGVDSLKEHMSDPILYALMHYKEHLVYVVYVDEKLSGVRRARTVVHGRTVASFFDQHDVHVYVNRLDNLTQEAIEQQVGNKGGSSVSDAPAPIKNGSIKSKELPIIPQEPPKEEHVTLPLISEPISLPPNSNSSSKDKKSGAISSPESEATGFSESINFNIKTESSLNAESKESKKLLEVEAKRKIQEAWKNRESVRIQFDHTKDQGNAAQLSGYITVQGGGCCFWKRRWFVLRGETLYFYRDPLDRYPVSCLDLGGTKLSVEQSSLETLIPHCFRLIISKDGGIDVYQFFSDSEKQKELAVAGILESSKH